MTIQLEYVPEINSRAYVARFNGVKVWAWTALEALLNCYTLTVDNVQ